MFSFLLKKRVLAETHFTRRELRAIYRAFKETSSNALIHRDIFRAMFAELFPHGDTEHYADLIFETSSRNYFQHSLEAL
uniref:Uncharacterized protein n=1 Tax=Parascaris equorum TaxID=6256 RepID=A0A914RX44_PAREQ